MQRADKLRHHELATQPKRAKLLYLAGLSREIVDSDDKLRIYIRANIGTCCHASGTVPIGPEDDPDAVLDQKCKVHGIHNLYVVDASVFQSFRVRCPT